MPAPYGPYAICSDAPTRLRVWAPRLRRLHLGGCRALRSLRLLQQEPEKYQYDAMLDDVDAADAGAAAAGAASGGSPGPAGPAEGGNVAAGSSSHATATPEPQAPAVWVNLSGTVVSRYTLKQLRTHPRVGPERLVPPRWYGTGRSSPAYAHEYDSDGRLGHGGDRGSSEEDEGYAMYL